MPTMHGNGTKPEEELGKLDQASTLRHKVAKTFRSAEGQVVLEWILLKCCFMREPVNQREEGLRDFAMELFHTVNKADTGIIQELLSRWQLDYARGQQAERERLTKEIKES